VKEGPASPVRLGCSSTRPSGSSAGPPSEPASKPARSSCRKNVYNNELAVVTMDLAMTHRVQSKFGQKERHLEDIIRCFAQVAIGMAKRQLGIRAWGLEGQEARCV